MEDCWKSQVAKSVLLLLALLFVLIPPSFKSSYLYFLINSLIVVIGAEAGFIGDGKKKTTAAAIMAAAAAALPPPVIAELITLQEEGRAESTMNIAEIADDEKNGIEGAEEEEDVDGDLSEEELFTRAEAFIDSFYKQLKMQRTGGV